MGHVSLPIHSGLRLLKGGVLHILIERLEHVRLLLMLLLRGLGNIRWSSRLRAQIIFILLLQSIVNLLNLDLGQLSMIFSLLTVNIEIVVGHVFNYDALITDHTQGDRALDQVLAFEHLNALLGWSLLIDDGLLVILLIYYR